VKTMNKLYLIKSIKKHIEVKEKGSSFLLILGDCPVGGSSVGWRVSTFSKNKSRFDCLSWIFGPYKSGPSKYH